MGNTASSPPSPRSHCRSQSDGESCSGGGCLWFRSSRVEPEECHKPHRKWSEPSEKDTAIRSVRTSSRSGDDAGSVASSDTKKAFVSGLQLKTRSDDSQHEGEISMLSASPSASGKKHKGLALVAAHSTASTASPTPVVTPQSQQRRRPAPLTSDPSQSSFQRSDSWSTIARPSAPIVIVTITAPPCVNPSVSALRSTTGRALRLYSPSLHRDTAAAASRDVSPARGWKVEEHVAEDGELASFGTRSLI